MVDKIRTKKNSSQNSASRRSAYLNKRPHGRRMKYHFPIRLSVIVEGNVGRCLERAVYDRVNGRSDMTSVLQDAISLYIKTHGLRVLDLDEYRREVEKEATAA